MRKLFALLFVAGTLALSSCGEKKAEESAKADSTAVAPEATPAPMDSAAAAPADSMKMDSAAAPAGEMKK